MELTNEFLLHKSRQWELTGEQEEVFIRKFGQGQSNRDIAGELGISINACVQCLGEIYKKANIQGNSRGKAHRLRATLVQEATPSAPGTAVQRGTAYIPPDLLPVTVAAPESEMDGDANRHYLEDLLNKLQQQAQDLSVNPDGDAADKALQLLSDHLPKSTAALASESHWKRVEVVRHIIHQVSKLFTTIDPSLEDCDGLSFLSPENAFGNPLHRSITAFIQRTSYQLKREHQSLPMVDSIVQAVFQQGQERFKDKTLEPTKDNPTLKTYSAWVRKTCFSLLLDHLNPHIDTEQTLLIDPRHGIDRNLLAVDVACLKMYLGARKDDVLDLNYFDILVARWMKSVPWREDSGPASRNEDHPMLYSIDPVDLEWASLSALRRRYHALDVLKKYELLRDYFLDQLKEVKDTYCDHFWLSYEDIQAFADSKYQIVGIPHSCLGIQGMDRDNCEAMARDVWRYCELAAYSRLNQNHIDEINELLTKACQSTVLDFWFNEIDHFMDHQWFRQGQIIIPAGAQIAR